MGECVEEAARREIFEEAGISVEDLRLLNVFSGEELYYKYPHGDEVYNVDVVYYASKYRGNISLNDESSDYAFFVIADIPNDVSPPQRPIVEYLKTKFPIDKQSI